MIRPVLEKEFFQILRYKRKVSYTPRMNLFTRNFGIFGISIYERIKNEKIEKYINGIADTIAFLLQKGFTKEDFEQLKK